MIAQIDGRYNMKLYKFSSYWGLLGSYKGLKIELYNVEEIEVKEKPKTYCGDGFRISKDDIGDLDPWGKMYLLENNPKQFLSALLGRQLKKVARLNAEIDAAKKYAEQIKTALEELEQ